MLLVFGCHDYGNGYFYKMRIWISYGNRCLYLTTERMGHEVCPPKNYYGKDGP
jgi:hypothetical protein